MSPFWWIVIGVAMSWVICIALLAVLLEIEAVTARRGRRWHRDRTARNRLKVIRHG